MQFTTSFTTQARQAIICPKIVRLKWRSFFAVHNTLNAAETTAVYFNYIGKFAYILPIRNGYQVYFLQC